MCRRRRREVGVWHASVGSHLRVFIGPARATPPWPKNFRCSREQRWTGPPSSDVPQEAVRFLHQRDRRERPYGTQTFAQELKALAKPSEGVDAGGCWREVIFLHRELGRTDNARSGVLPGQRTKVAGDEPLLFARWIDINGRPPECVRPSVTSAR